MIESLFPTCVWINCGTPPGNAVHDRHRRFSHAGAGHRARRAAVLTSKGQLWQNRAVYSLISVLVNVFRSIPFIILIVLLIPFTKSLIGTILGADAALPALIVGAAPFYARLVEIALREVDKGVIEAARSMGAKTAP